MRHDTIIAGRGRRLVRVERKRRPLRPARHETRAEAQLVAEPTERDVSTVGLLAASVRRLIRHETGRFERELWGT